MKNPLLFIVTDIHLTGENSVETEDLMMQAFCEASALGFDHIYVSGDVFDSRKAQTLKALESWLNILNKALELGITLRTIPGNHDKPSYKSERSYLDIYSMHPSMDLTRDHRTYRAGDFVIHMIPFFDERDVYPEYLSKSLSSLGENPDSRHILITHIAVDGVKNNDGSEIQDTLSPKSFSNFERVFVGHYHDYQEVGNVVYVGAVRQKNFGENKTKGFTVVYDDGSWNQIKSYFKEYETVKINLNTITETELKKLMDEYKDPKDNIRFKMSGTKEKLKSIDKSRFEEIGIDIKCEQDDPEVIIDYLELADFEGFDSTSIKLEWEDFSEKNEIVDDIRKSGKLLLEKVLK